MQLAAAIAAAAAFVWLGMVLAISFLEAPLKFRAPDVTLRIGLGIGRIVFRALNRAEVVLALVLVGAAAAVPALRVVVGALVVVLAAQLAVVRPRLNRRSDRVLAGEDVPRSREHLVYVVAEVGKVVLLATAGVLALGA
jgi:hypothetical protein